MTNVRTTTISARAALVGTAAVMCLGGMAAQGQARAAGDRAIVVSQDPGGTSIGIGHREPYDKNQKIGQTFVVPEDNVKLTSISTYLGGHDSVAIIKIYEVGEDAPLGTLLATVRDRVTADWGDPGEGWHTHSIKPGIPMHTGLTYSFVISSKRAKPIASAAHHGLDEYTGGEWYCLCPTPYAEDVNQDGYASDFDFDNWSWSSATELDSHVRDVAFKLRFRRLSTTQ